MARLEEVQIRGRDVPEVGAGARLGEEGAVDAPPDSALRALTEAQRLASAVRELAWDGAAVTVAPQRTGSLGVRLAAHLAESAADLLTDPGIARVRQCEAEGCVLLFLAADPCRRWCSAARCGHRAHGTLLPAPQVDHGQRLGGGGELGAGSS
ncbi:CGNR zinc finger domain-containing protein [Streptomyces sp. NPDC055134]